MAATLGEGGLHTDAERSLHALVGGSAVEGHQRGHCNIQTNCQSVIGVNGQLKIKGGLIKGYFNKLINADSVYFVGYHTQSKCHQLHIKK